MVRSPTPFSPRAVSFAFIMGDTQVEMAKRLCVAYQTYVQWEQNQRTPRGLALEALNAKLDALLAK